MNKLIPLILAMLALGCANTSGTRTNSLHPKDSGCPTGYVGVKYRTQHFCQDADEVADAVEGLQRDGRNER